MYDKYISNIGVVRTETVGNKTIDYFEDGIVRVKIPPSEQHILRDIHKQNLKPNEDFFIISYDIPCYV